MKALIQKDVYVLWKQMGLFLLVIAAMSFVNSTFNCVFLVVWSSMLPYTAMAYDERSHWDQLAVMMPYSRRDLVLSKYVLGWLCMGAVLLLCLVMQTGVSLLPSGRATDLTTLMTSLCLGVISLDITLPAIMRFGVERGRMIFMLIIFAVAIAGGVLIDTVEEMPRIFLPAMAVLPLAAVIATVVSIPLSMKLYKAN